MRRPAGILYGVEEAPPAGVVVLSAFQHLGVMSILLIYPVLLSREAASTPQFAGNIVSVTFLVLGVGTLLQALHRGPVGSGFLCQPTPSAAYLVPSLLAASHGGLPLAFGMTVFGGLVQVAVSRVLRSLRPLFPPEVAGLVVALIGLSAGALGIRTFLGGGAGSLGAAETITAAATLGTMIALNVWTRGVLRLSCVLIGIVVGFGVTALVGGVKPGAWETLSATPWMALPHLGQVGWAFDANLAIPFAVTAVAASLTVVGNVTTCQKLNDADWVRADMNSISRGVLADGLATTLAGALGTGGVNSSSAAVGLSNATGILSRYVAYTVAGFLVLLAFFPKLGVIFFLMPGAMAGMVLLFAATFIFVSGLEIMTSRLIDARRTFVIGLSVMCGLAVDLIPGASARFPGWIQPLLVGSLVLGPVMALLLNGAFRVGVRRTRHILVDPARPAPATIEQFMEASGAAWGARRDVIDRATFNLLQSIETIVDGCAPAGPLDIQASFDEFRLDLLVTYPGPPLELPDQRPSNEEIMASEEGQRRLAGFMLRRYADRVAATHKAGRSTILFHFDH